MKDWALLKARSGDPGSVVNYMSIKHMNCLDIFDCSVQKYCTIRKIAAKLVYCIPCLQVYYTTQPCSLSGFTVPWVQVGGGAVPSHVPIQPLPVLDPCFPAHKPWTPSPNVEGNSVCLLTCSELPELVGGNQSFPVETNGDRFQTLKEYFKQRNKQRPR